MVVVVVDVVFPVTVTDSIVTNEHFTTTIAVVGRTIVDHSAKQIFNIMQVGLSNFSGLYTLPV